MTNDLGLMKYSADPAVAVELARRSLTLVCLGCGGSEFREVRPFEWRCPVCASSHVRVKPVES